MWPMLGGLFRRCYAYAFGFTTAPGERAGLAAQRHDLLAAATGVTLEIGAGTGLNLRHYPPDVSRLLLVEPDQHMMRWLRRRAEQVSPAARLVAAVAGQLPFPEATIDTVVVTFTLCSVPDVPQALQEIARVLAPGGRLLFMEHVRSAESRIAARQDKIPLQYRLIGCHPNRETLREIMGSPLALESFRRGEVPRAPAIERPMVAGIASRAGKG
jgi:SAM-dependent methyltransferase